MTNDNTKNKRNNKSNNPKRVCDYPDHLQGLSSNKHGGTTLQGIKGYRGAKYGPAGPAKIYTPQEIYDYANDNDLQVAPSVLAKLWNGEGRP